MQCIFLDAKLTDWLMVGLTGLYVCVNGYLLVTVRRQTESAIHAERAWLFESAVPQCRRGGNEPFGCIVRVTNFGRSPAWISSVSGGFKWINDADNLPAKPTYEHINWGSILPLAPGEESDRIYVKHQLGTEPTANTKLAIFVSIQYRDRFNLKVGKPYVLKFCFVSVDRSTSSWSVGGPTKYNEHG